jgi:NADH-quinone oxidoreductase subunit F
MPRLVSHPDEVIVLKRRFGQGAASIDKYVEMEGYAAVQKAIAQGAEAMPGWIIDTMKSSGLRGRGGAGFPTGMKWSFVPKTSAKPKYILVNGDESEPGTCKDHVLLREDPHAIIEGAMIAGLAIGAKTGFIYLRGEYRYLLEIMEQAVADAYSRGYLGKNIFGSGLAFDIITQTGAGAYEVGEARGAENPPSLPCCGGAVRRADDHQQRGDHRQCAAHSADGRGGIRAAGDGAQRRHAAVWD